MKSFAYIAIISILFVSCQDNKSTTSIKSPHTTFDTTIIRTDSVTVIVSIDSNNIKFKEDEYYERELIRRKWFYSNEVVKREQTYILAFPFNEYNFDSLGTLKTIVNYAFKTDTLLDGRGGIEYSYFNKIKTFNESGELDRANSITCIWLLKDGKTSVKKDELFNARLEYIDGCRDYDTIWFETGAYKWPYFEVDPNLGMQQYLFDSNQVCELTIPTNGLGTNHYCGRIFAANDDTTYTMNVVLDYEVME